MVPLESMPPLRLVNVLVRLLPPMSSVPPVIVIVLVPSVPLPERINVPSATVVVPLMVLFAESVTVPLPFFVNALLPPRAAETEPFWRMKPLVELRVAVVFSLITLPPVSVRRPTESVRETMLKVPPLML